MFNNKFIFLFCILIATSCGTSKKNLKKYNIVSIKQDVEILSSDKMEGRETGTFGELRASEYINKRMVEIGLWPGGKSDGYVQVFSKTIKANPHSTEPSPDDKIIKGRNIIGKIDNKAPLTVVIGAHYDHLGYGAEGSLHTGEPEIHNGADDNASGVAGLLRLAEELVNQPDSAYNYLFIAFSGEEKGLWGSNYFSKNPTMPFNMFNFMINMDMIGRLSEDKKIAIYGTGTTPLWKKAIQLPSAENFKIKEEESGLGPSDHTSFYLENLPVLHFFTGQHADYHRPTDDAHLINYNGILEITNFILDIIQYSKNREKLRFTKTKDESQAVPDFNVTLGVIPDYLYDDIGMRIDGIKENRPAYNANLKKGDIVIQMQDQKITDMMAYMKALSTFKKGQTITITIVRNGKENTRKLTF